VCGHDVTRGINQIANDGNIISDTNYTVWGRNTKGKFDYFVAMMPTRLLTKDEIEKESVSISYKTGTYHGDVMDSQTSTGDLAVEISDYGAKTGYKIWPCGEVGLLYTGSNTKDDNNKPVGVVAYQAGIFLFNPSSSFSNMGHDDRNRGILNPMEWGTGADIAWSYSGSVTPWVTASGAQIYGGPLKSYWGVTGSMVSASIDEMADSFRRRIGNFSFRNTTELNSTIYHCRVSGDDFNYSSNPTYLSQSQIRVKTNAGDPPIS